VPYAYGALYNTLYEAFIGDAIGTTLIFWITGLSTRQAIWFATLSIIKAVHDHCGYEFPYHPLDMISSQNPAYHDIHHQSWGMKYNYSQVYLTFWVCECQLFVRSSLIREQDDLLGTTVPPEIAAEKYAKAQEKLKEKAT
jgi:hypothetical protein